MVKTEHYFTFYFCSTGHISPRQMAFIIKNGQTRIEQVGDVVGQAQIKLRLIFN